ncbi:MAG: oxidoreductase [Betaproteobacteria bacterium HGW-Betaproteobacteria-18]|jgi:vanillate O-demethylase ferredoxin subunit|nr:MAG: oxidoreductase [Betaproteobacteria bacterium HGW-Betaproteobacteria-6]PKO62708.1 MAG: oxidoreductase [Betaproteobacteria bacterium HGW-Betaproteobacteria-18]PKO91440.1 MAG: oxidoreductase [Betaproteobacteria bacterium HGW-Betaproteobacteria-10]
MSTLRVRLAVKTPETPDICRLELVPVAGEALPAFTAGAHIDLHLPGGLVRSYSLCNDPAESHRYVLGILRDANSRGGSKVVHEALQVGDQLTISRPSNHFELDPSATSSLLLAGGIGITPLLAMAEQLHRAKADFELHYTAARRDRMAFAGHLAAAPYVERVHTYLSQEDPAQRLDLDALLAKPAAGRHLYVCGPQRFIDAVLDSARRQGWDEAVLHWEFFAGANIDSTADRAFEIEVASSGQIVPVAPGQTALKALAAAGIDVPMACEQGVCGTCLTKVLGGEVEHRDLYLTPEEQAAGDQFLPCCSRASSARLVLDL